MPTLNFAHLLAAAQPGTPPPAWVQMVPLILIFVIFYFLLIRPQQKRQRELAELVKSLKPGDKVVTSGGILGVVVAVKDNSVSIRSADTKLELLKTAVSEVTERAGQAAPAKP
jgi:preprotein translocase subunit YajC